MNRINQTNNLLFNPQLLFSKLPRRDEGIDDKSNNNDDVHKCTSHHNQNIPQPAPLDEQTSPSLFMRQQQQQQQPLAQHLLYYTDVNFEVIKTSRKEKRERKVD